MEKLDAILWTGYNLKQVIEFTGKSKQFDEWFKSWKEYEDYVEKHDRIFKLFSPDGTSVDVLPETWIIKLPDGYNVPVVNGWLQSKNGEKRKLKKEIKKDCDYGYGGRCWDDGNF